MTEVVRSYLQFYQQRTYRSNRIDGGKDISYLVKDMERLTAESFRVCEMLAAECPTLYSNDIFGFHRYQKDLPCYELSCGISSPVNNPGNITPNYRRIMDLGFDAILQDLTSKKSTANGDSILFYEAIERQLLAFYPVVESYRKLALEQNNLRLATALAHVPAQPPRSFYEACLFMHMIAYLLRCALYSHLTLGRFDQYMYSYYLADLARGVSREELLETLELYFIAMNFDTDLYHGVQKGDNGQSMVLGGFSKHGESMFNELSQLCMEASLELSLIDPKINLRCGKNTPLELYELGTKMTKQGLGFPQYCNDDIVVPGLIALGYDEEDARNYTVAACWEFIIPNCSMDIPNRGTMNFPAVVNRALHRHLSESADFDTLMDFVKKEIQAECRSVQQRHWNYQLKPSSLLSLFVDGCLEKGLDLSQGGAKYNNYGIHGVGIADATDALSAVKHLIYDTGTLEKDVLLSALNANFEGYAECRNRLLNLPYKMGNNDDATDEIAASLMQCFADTMNDMDNGHGGIWRTGTGSAMEYVLSSRNCPATANGRRAGAPFAANFSPSITARLNGPLSVIQSFTKFDLRKIINGGPLTLEIHDTVFRNAEGEKKVAQLVKTFILLGGHQLQLNSINRDVLLAAQRNPEQYPNLIVRVWGWSGYFCELDREYQNHIIRRTEFQI